MNQYDYLNTVGGLTVLARTLDVVKSLYPAPEHLVTVIGKDEIPPNCVQIVACRTAEIGEADFERFLRHLIDRYVPFDGEGTFSSDHFTARLDKDLTYRLKKRDAFKVVPRSWENQEERWCQFQTEKLLDS